MRWQGSLKRALHASAALLLAAGCGQILGVSDYRTARPDAGARKSDAGNPEIVFTDNPNCGACVHGSCEAELGACRGERACARWESCMAACKPGDTEGPCEFACFAQAGQTDLAMGNIAACTFQHCLGECQSVAGFSSDAPGCSAAMRESCASQLQRCAADQSCLDVWRCSFDKHCLVWGGNPAPPGDGGPLSTVSRNPECMNECGDLSRVYDPQPTGPDGGLVAKPIVDLLVCQFGTPYAACRLGDLSCSGRYTWKPSSFQRINVDVTVHSGAFPESFGLPMRHVAIKACQLFPPEVCPSHPGYDLSKSTDSNGRATFQLPTEVSGDYWYFEVTTGWQNGPSRLLFNTGRRLREDTAFSLATQEGGFSSLKGSDAGLRWDPTRGMVSLYNRGCEVNLVGNLSVRIDGAASGAWHTQYSGTTSGAAAHSQGTFGAQVSDVDPGFHTVSAWSGGTKVAEDTILVEADAITLMNWFYPSRTPGSIQ